MCGFADMMREESDMEGMGKEAIWQMVQQLQGGLQAREKQLERQGQQLASMQEVQHQLQVSPQALTPTPVQGRGMREGVRRRGGGGWRGRWGGVCQVETA